MLEDSIKQHILLQSTCRLVIERFVRQGASPAIATEDHRER